MFNKIASLENLIRSFYQARRLKRYYDVVCKFDFDLENNLIKIRDELVSGKYTPLPYHHFIVTDPKTRHIAAPHFRDRIVHHSLVNVIEPLFEKAFIIDSYACRSDKGTHFGEKRVKKFLMATRTYYGKNTPIYALQCDIRKYFPSISWDILLKIVNKKISCPITFSLIEKIITTHRTMDHKMVERRLPNSST